ncbi:hypothetical protein JHW43_007224 [Diplocarpon mali]|nr:hypothetical protein JHW43_007224 [Diplocarpon mali]
MVEQARDGLPHRSGANASSKAGGGLDNTSGIVYRDEMMDGCGIMGVVKYGVWYRYGCGTDMGVVQIWVWYRYGSGMIHRYDAIPPWPVGVGVRNRGRTGPYILRTVNEDRSAKPAKLPRRGVIESRGTGPHVSHPGRERGCTERRCAERRGAETRRPERRRAETRRPEREGHRERQRQAEMQQPEQKGGEIGTSPQHSYLAVHTRHGTRPLPRPVDVWAAALVLPSASGRLGIWDICDGCCGFLGDESLWANHVQEPPTSLEDLMKRDNWTLTFRPSVRSEKKSDRRRRGFGHAEPRAPGYLSHSSAGDTPLLQSSDVDSLSTDRRVNAAAIPAIKGQLAALPTGDNANHTSPFQIGGPGQFAVTVDSTARRRLSPSTRRSASTAHCWTDALGGTPTRKLHTLLEEGHCQRNLISKPQQPLYESPCMTDQAGLPCLGGNEGIDRKVHLRPSDHPSTNPTQRPELPRPSRRASRQYPTGELEHGGCSAARSAGRRPEAACAPRHGCVRLVLIPCEPFAGLGALLYSCFRS